MPKNGLGKKISLIYIWLVFYLFCGVILPVKPLHAQTNSDHFHTTLTSTYTVDISGNTRVEHHFRIRNLTPEYFISSYSMKLGTDAISSINVTSNQQAISPEVKQDGTGTMILINFPDNLVGKDKTRDFRISYLNPVLSEVNGQVLETFIPAMGSAEAYNEHLIELITPLRFGHPTRIKPDNFSIKQDGQNFVTSYSNLTDQGISAIFGSQQIFNLSIRYHLNNPNNQPAITQVSLPPDTPHQKIIYHQLQPQPQEIVADADGNWIATYYLPANDIIEIEIEATVKFGLDELHPWLNPTPISEHFTQQTFWEKDHPQIQQIAAELTDAYSIYQYVVENLSYTQNDLTGNLERLGAVGVLKKSDQATCQEFSDLFIALARAKGIPTRRATGYAHSNDPILQPLSQVTDVLHAWPEYFDQEQERWIPIDPTWGNTMKGVDYFHQFDLKHITFAYNGKSSRLPLAAGNYKLPNQESKDLEVKFGQEFEIPDQSFVIKLKPRKLFGLIDLPSWYELIIENETGVAWYNNQLELSSENEFVEISSAQQNLTLLPWEQKVLLVQVFNEQHLLPKSDQIVIRLTQNEQQQEAQLEVKTIKPVTANLSQFVTQTIKDENNFLTSTINQIDLGFVWIALGTSLAIGTIATGSVLVFRWRQRRLVRRQGQESQEKGQELHSSKSA